MVYSNYYIIILFIESSSYSMHICERVLETVANHTWNLVYFCMRLIIFINALSNLSIEFHVRSIMKYLGICNTYHVAAINKMCDLEPFSKIQSHICCVAIPYSMCIYSAWNNSRTLNIFQVTKINVCLTISGFDQTKCPNKNCGLKHSFLKLLPVNIRRS